MGVASRKLVVYLTIVALAVTLAGCAGTVEEAAEGGTEEAGGGEPIKIGVLGPISGQWAYEGEGFVNAVTLLADKINEEGGLLGRPIEIVQGDSRGDPKESALAAQKLVNSGVIAAIGSYSSTCTEPASDIFNEAGILQITPSSTATPLTQKGYERFFRTCFLDDRQGLFAAEFIANELKADTAALLHDNTTYAKGLADWTKKYLEERGVEVVFFDAITPGEKDYTPTLTRLKGTNPDVIYFTGYYPEGGLLVRQAKELGITAQFMAGNAVNNPEFVKMAGLEYAKGSIITTEPLPHDLPYPEAQQFLEDYKAKYGEPPTSIWTVLAADAFRVIVEGIKGAQSTDPADIAKYLHEELKDFPGVTGPITFDEKGDRKGTIHKAYVVDEEGEFVPYEQ